MDILEICGWKKCTQVSTIIYYGLVGLCDKHCEEWMSKKEAFDDAKKSSKFLLKTHCSPDIRKYYKNNPDVNKK